MCPGDEGVKRMEPSSSVSGPGHHRFVEPVRMKHKSVVCCGRAVPLLWRVWSMAVRPSRLGNINRYCEKPVVAASASDVMLLADQGLPIMS